MAEIPANITAGMKTEWTVSNTDYLASDGYTLKYVLINSTSKISIVSTADGDDHLVSIPSATSALYTAGTYTAKSYFEKAGEKYEYKTEQVVVLPDYTATSTTFYDTRSFAKKSLDALEAVIQNKAGELDLEYEIEGRRIVKMTPSDRIKWRNYFKDEYEAEQRALNAQNGKPNNRIVKITFGQTS